MIESQDSILLLQSKLYYYDHDSESALTIMIVNKDLLVRYGAGPNNYCRERGFTFMISSQASLQC